MQSEWHAQNGNITLRMTTTVAAPIDRCFLLTCAIALVQEELGMRPVEGRTSGLVVGGDTVRWQGWQLGLRHHHVSLISGYQCPTFLQDTMLEGRFQRFQHDHHLRELPDGSTELHDEVRFSLPFGAVGRMVGQYIMVPHIRGLLSRRFHRIARIATGDAWRRYVPDTSVDASHIREGETTL